MKNEVAAEEDVEEKNKKRRRKDERIGRRKLFLPKALSFK